MTALSKYPEEVLSKFLEDNPDPYIWKIFVICQEDKTLDIKTKKTIISI
jgi:hypothetical protein